MPQIKELSHVHGVELLRGLRFEFLRDVGQVKVHAVPLGRKVDAKHVADPLRSDEGFYRAERDRQQEGVHRLPVRGVAGVTNQVDFRPSFHLGVPAPGPS